MPSQYAAHKPMEASLTIKRILGDLVSSQEEETRYSSNDIVIAQMPKSVHDQPTREHISADTFKTLFSQP